MNGVKKHSIDLTGNSFSDIMVVEDDSLTYYPSLGKQGYDLPVKKIFDSHLDSFKNDK